jgi:ergot alkaloid biosynthesis protein
MTRILVTGGTGTTGSRVARRLSDQGHEARVATRTPDKAGEVLFDWFKPDSHAAATSGVDAVYLVAPTGALDVLEAMRPGLETALSAGVRRFVLLSASALNEGDPMMGQVHAYLRAYAPEWEVLRPSWFMQNLTGQHGQTIRDENAIYSATQKGRVPFIDADDIAAVAVRALTDDRPLNDDLLLTGPAALSYAEVADILSSTLGRNITHHALSADAMAGRFVQTGLDPSYAQLLAQLDAAIAEGAEDRTTDIVEHITGRPPTSLAAFAEIERRQWERSSPRRNRSGGLGSGTHA